MCSGQCALQAASLITTYQPLSRFIRLILCKCLEHSCNGSRYASDTPGTDFHASWSVPASTSMSYRSKPDHILLLSHCSWMYHAIRDFHSMRSWIMSVPSSEIETPSEKLHASQCCLVRPRLCITMSNSDALYLFFCVDYSLSVHLLCRCI